MIRVVIDTNVYVSALVFGGKPAAVLRLAESGAFQVVVTTIIQQELVETLNTKFGWPSERAESTCRELWDEAWWVLRPEAVEESRDPADNAILGCALESQAQVIITGDQDLLVLHPFRSIKIVSPAEFLARSLWRELA